MGKVYIVYYDFKATSGNHAGMSHLVKLLKEGVPRVKLIKSLPHHYKGGQYLARIYAILLAVYFRFVLKKEDKVFFFEYLTKGTAYQALTARLMRKFGLTGFIYALIHLSGQHLLELYGSSSYILASLKPIDKIFVFGSSLARFVRELGYQKEIVTTFHYVDTSFYKPDLIRKAPARLQVICIGGLKRNFSLLETIVSQLPDIDFHILMGKKNLRPFFLEKSNVKLYQFLREEEMLHLMQGTDLSLSVMEDTIGSNVITTSMAVGLVLVVSDVGSIKDYCNPTNSIFCTKKEDYLEGIRLLDKNRPLLAQMRQAALRRANELSHNVFIEKFKSMV